MEKEAEEYGDASYEYSKKYNSQRKWFSVVQFKSTSSKAMIPYTYKEILKEAEKKFIEQKN